MEWTCPYAISLAKQVDAWWFLSLPADDCSAILRSTSAEQAFLDAVKRIKNKQKGTKGIELAV